jgi:EmrB/QacA subfamily drug resistance transporter
VRAHSSNSRFVLPVVLAGTFMAILDVSIVVVAIPSIRADLHAGYGAVEFVITAYTLTYASLLVIGGRLGDRFGRRRMFILGLLGFSGASALCGAAPTISVLVGARALQGVGGALMFPQVLAIIQVTFDGQARNRALGLFGSVIGIAAIAGQLVGGVLLALNLFGLTWRPLFLVNVPLGALAALAAARVLPKDPPDPETRLDLSGAGMIAIAQLLLTLPLLEGREHGWPVWMIACLIAAVPAFTVFLVYERRLAARGGSPLVPLRLFGNRGFAGGVPIALLVQASYTIFALTLSIYLQAGLGFSPLHAGAVYTPNAIGFFITSLTAPRLVPLLGRHVLTLGYIVATLGLLAAAATAAAAGGGLAGWELAPPLFIAGLGQGLGYSPLVGTIIAGLEPADAGSGAGVVTTTLQTGNVLGVAAGGLLFFTLLGGAHQGGSYANAYALVLVVAASLLVLAAVLVHWLPVTQFEAQNALIERLPGWATGFAYSMFLMTGGRIGDRLFANILSRVTERRLRRTEDAPQDPGEFFVYHYDAMSEDGAWLNYLEREALTYGTGTIPHEQQRLPVIQAQVDEIRRRQDAGLIDPELDPRLVRLLGFALASYPRLLPQITRMTTGAPPEDPQFIAEWETFIRTLGKRLAIPRTEL